MKRTTKHATCQIQMNKVWSTLQAQLLAKISNALKLKKIDFTNYKAFFHIPCMLSKPRVVLANNTVHHNLLIW